MTGIDRGSEGQKEGLIMLGCPEAAAQVSVALHIAHGLRKMGLVPVVAGNPSARSLVAMADPDRHYVGEMVDLDACIEALVAHEKDYAVSFVLIHRESGVSYAGTVGSVSAGRLVAVVFGKEAGELAGLIDFPCERVVAKAVHNVLPLSKDIDRVMGWDA
ncbi:DUF1890 domain-containing protein [Methanofollis ethanolicus]|uniref:DUF1890 domain-containing protein n=1 Tax=Methanofollis ethanolicus TaxID=488124 RepID=UPI000833E928|nr:DUF1890 domain-containing protein [Methanofollis ethanolicus]